MHESGAVWQSFVLAVGQEIELDLSESPEAVFNFLFPHATIVPAKYRRPFGFVLTLDLFIFLDLSTILYFWSMVSLAMISLEQMKLKIVSIRLGCSTIKWECFVHHAPMTVWETRLFGSIPRADKHFHIFLCVTLIIPWSNYSPRLLNESRLSCKTGHMMWINPLNRGDCNLIIIQASLYRRLWPIHAQNS